MGLFRFDQFIKIKTCFTIRLYKRRIDRILDFTGFFLLKTATQKEGQDRLQFPEPRQPVVRAEKTPVGRFADRLLKTVERELRCRGLLAKQFHVSFENGFINNRGEGCQAEEHALLVFREVTKGVLDRLYEALRPPCRPSLVEGYITFPQALQHFRRFSALQVRQDHLHRHRITIKELQDRIEVFVFAVAFIDPIALKNPIGKTGCSFAVEAGQVVDIVRVKRSAVTNQPVLPPPCTDHDACFPTGEFCEEGAKRLLLPRGKGVLCRRHVTGD